LTLSNLKTEIGSPKKNNTKPNGSIIRSPPRQGTLVEGRRNSCLGGRNSSIGADKYAGALEKLRKEKYEKTLRLEKTRCEFDAEK
jgi:hypothetical protein